MEEDDKIKNKNIFLPDKFWEELEKGARHADKMAIVTCPEYAKQRVRIGKYREKQVEKKLKEKEDAEKKFRERRVYGEGGDIGRPSRIAGKGE